MRLLTRLVRYKVERKGHGIPYFSILRALEDVGGKVSIQLRQHEHRVGGVDNLYVNTCKNKSLDTISRLAKKVGAKRLTFNKLPEVVKIDRNYIVMKPWTCCCSSRWENNRLVCWQ